MFRGIRDFLELIKFEHTLFALPFAYLGMFLAARTAAGGTSWPTWHQAIWVTVAMAAARTLAMAANRLADRHIDAANPRTADRPLVSGRVAPRTASAGAVIALIVLVLAAWQLGPMPLTLLPGALVFLVGYPYAKRVTWLSHFILGFTDGLAPAGAWVAVRGTLFAAGDLPAWLLLGAVTFWIGGFDLIYACQDAEFDRDHGLKAIPARFGIAATLRLSVISHVLAIALLAGLGSVAGLSWPYGVGLVVAGGLLIAEHVLVNPHDLSRLNIAFFHINSVISLTLFAGVVTALAIGSN